MFSTNTRRSPIVRLAHPTLPNQGRGVVGERDAHRKFLTYLKVTMWSLVVGTDIMISVTHLTLRLIELSQNGGRFYPTFIVP